LLFFYRDGESGNGRLVMNSYSTKTGKWTRVQENLIDGEGKRSAYTQIAVGRNGLIHMSWVWRETPDVASNHDICYARSFDGGRTWTKSTGEPYRLPITSDNAEIAWKVPQNSELINQTSMAVDNSGRPSVATYWRDADSPVPQYRVVYLRDGRWRMSQVSDRKTPFSLSGGGTKRIPISRPQIAVDGRRVYVIFRDEERGNRPSVAVAEAIERGWRIVDLADNDLGMWEPSFDLNLWNRKKILDLFVQRVGQGDGERLEDLEPQMISILEWRPR
ncbi:MAG TPA: BNR repeat-containing protein, partial [Pyrinomonadaceae bacterium]|nr:BNR repeat-containing protein [Pyrinomonadaceae bacterium]